MYKVMIIDDEIAIRKLICKIVDWDILNAEVVGEAESGIEAINTIDDLRPDIVIVDIQMPFMNGIDFSKMAVKRYPDLKIIVLSAYDDFKYAQQCIKIGVSRYLLKPIIKKEIQDTLTEIITTMPIKNPDQIEEYEGYIGIDEIKCYVENNYTCSELNMSLAAEHFGFNTSYFSRKVKEILGVGFSEFLNSYRLKKAHEYADSGKLMYMTAESVGIPDPKYFSKCFKKYYGISYSDYMKEKGEP